MARVVRDEAEAGGRVFKGLRDWALCAGVGPPSPALGSMEGQSKGGLACIIPSDWVP